MQAFAQLSVACSTVTASTVTASTVTASTVTASDGKLGEGLGMRLGLGVENISCHMGWELLCF